MDTTVDLRRTEKGTMLSCDVQRIWDVAGRNIMTYDQSGYGREQRYTGLASNPAIK